MVEFSWSSPRSGQITKDKVMGKSRWKSRVVEIYRSRNQKCRKVVVEIKRWRNQKSRKVEIIIVAKSKWKSRNIESRNPKYGKVEMEIQRCRN